MLKDRRIAIGVTISTKALEIGDKAIDNGEFKNLSRFIDHLILEHGKER